MIYLIRHAPTKGNLLGRYVGRRTDERLSLEGIDLAEKKGADTSVRLVYVSGLRRTAETAAILYPEAELVALRGLDEMDFGEFENRHWRDMGNELEYRRWVAGSCLERCPGGEEMAEFSERCCSAFLEVLRSQDPETEDLHFVIHGGTIMSILSSLAEPEQDYFSWKCGHLGRYMVSADTGNPERPLRVVEKL